MHIVHFIQQLSFGGLQTVVMGLSLAQRARGHSVEIAAQFGAGNNPGAIREMNRAGIKVTLPFRDEAPPISRPVETIRQIIEYFKERRFDVVHSHNPFCVHFATAAAKLAGIPTVNTLHATAMFPRMTRKDKAVFWGAALFSDRIVSVCSQVQTTLCDQFTLPSRKLFTVDNGIDPSSFLTVPRRSPRDEVIFGTMGRMTPVKNHRLLIEAFAQARRRYPRIRLRILGGGGLEADLRQRAHDLDLGDSVELLGFSADTAGFLAGLDVFVLSSNSEGLPMSLLEAIASGLPVVSTAVGGVPDVVRKTDSGWLAPPKDVSGLATAMESAIRCPDRIRRGEQARRVVAKYYTHDRMSADYDRVYETLPRAWSGSARADRPAYLERAP